MRSLRFLTELKRLIGRPVDSVRMYEGQHESGVGRVVHLDGADRLACLVACTTDISSSYKAIEWLEAAGVTCVRFAAAGRKESVRIPRRLAYLP
jgi:hypothetical protein